MGLMKNRKIGFKVLLACLVFVLLIAGISILSIFEMRSAAEGFTTFYADRFAPVRELNRIVANFLQMRIDMLQMYDAATKDDWARVAQRKANTLQETKSYQKDWKAYLATKMTPEEKKLVEEWKQLVIAPGKTRATFMRHLDARDLKKAYPYLAEWVKEYRLIRDKTKELLALQQREADKLRQEIEGAAAQSLIVSLVVLAVSVFIAALITLILTRTINGGIKGIISQMNDLTDDVVNGKLTNRGEAEKVLIDFREIVIQTNGLIDAFVKPIDVTVEYLDKIAVGDIPESIQDEYRGDFNKIKQAINSLIAAMNEITGLAQKISVGDLKVQVDKRSDKDPLMDALAKMVAELTDIAVTIQNASDQVASGSEQISSSAQEMSQGASEQASSIEEVSSSMEEMNSTITQNADNAQQTASIAEQAAIDAQKGGDSVNETVTAMRSIAEKISVIENIARQTNMLSLNAAIEAARAGEHGKGFAVVAEEVRKLAERSASAAREIGDLSVDSVDIAEKAGVLISEIVPGIQKTAELVNEINASSSEQARGIQQVTKAVQQLDQVVQQTASGSEELASTSEELSSQAVQMRDRASFFQVEEGKRVQFKDAVSQKSEATAQHAAPKPAGQGGHSKKMEAGSAGVTIELDDDDGDFVRL